MYNIINIIKLNYKVVLKPLTVNRYNGFRCMDLNRLDPKDVFCLINTRGSQFSNPDLV